MMKHDYYEAYPLPPRTPRQGGIGLEPETGLLFPNDEDNGFGNHDEYIDSNGLSPELAAMDEEIRREIAYDFDLDEDASPAMCAACLDGFARLDDFAA
jgi:hypothetical protein